MKTRYERPIIIKNVGGYANKFAFSSKMEVMDHIGGIAVSDLVAQFGSPLFVFSETIMRQHYRRFVDAFKNFYPKVQLAWSYKTNYLRAICAIYHQEGSIAEVVSDFEYEKAKKLGIEPADIIYNGPLKEFDSLKKACTEGAMIHIDNFEELANLEKIHDTYTLRPRVGVRLNMNTGIYPAWSRFGFNLENGEADLCIRRILKTNKMDLIGLHTHIGTFILSPEAYAQAVKKMAELYLKIEREFGITLQYLDLGGGFPSQNKLKAQYLPNAVAIPPIEQYAQKITEMLLAHFAPDTGPKIYLEAGRALVDEAGYLITTVHATHRLPDNRRALVIDAGLNLLFTATYYDLHFYATQPYYSTPENTVVYGPLCMNIDVVREAIPLPHINIGEKLVIHPVGAYNVTQWMQFIRTRPAIVLVSKDKNIHLIRRAETLEDIEALETLPEEYRLIEEE